MSDLRKIAEECWSEMHGGVEDVPDLIHRALARAVEMCAEQCDSLTASEQNVYDAHVANQRPRRIQDSYERIAAFRVAAERIRSLARAD